MIIELEDEMGQMVRVELVDRFEYNSRLYVIAYDVEIDTDAYILEAVDAGEGQISLESIQDEKVFDKIREYYESLDR